MTRDFDFTEDKLDAGYQGSADQSQKNRSLPIPVRRFWIVQMFLVLLWAAASAFRWFVQHKYNDLISPFRNTVHLYDLRCFESPLAYFHSEAFFHHGYEPFMYPPLMAVVYKFFFSFDHPERMFYCITGGLICAMALLLGRAIYRRGISLLTVAIFLGSVLILSYPLWFEYRLGNMEVCVFILITIGVWAFFRGMGYTSAACFGLAASMKIFPFVYFGLMIAKKQYRQVAFGLLVTATSTIAAFWLVCPSMGQSVRNIQQGLDTFRQRYVIHYRLENSFDHSIFALIKKVFPHLRPTETLAHVLPIYMACAACLGLVLYFVRIRHLPPVNQVLCLCIASILLPPTSHDYTLLHLYVPWALLILVSLRQELVQEKIRGLGAAFLCFAILFAPENEFLHNYQQFGGQIKAAILVVLMYIGLKYPFGSWKRPENQPFPVELR